MDFGGPRGRASNGNGYVKTQRRACLPLSFSKGYIFNIADCEPNTSSHWGHCWPSVQAESMRFLLIHS